MRGHVCVSLSGAFVPHAGPHAKSAATIAVQRSNKWKPNILNYIAAAAAAAISLALWGQIKTSGWNADGEENATHRQG